MFAPDGVQLPRLRVASRARTLDALPWGDVMAEDILDLVLKVSIIAACWAIVLGIGVWA